MTLTLVIHFDPARLSPNRLSAMVWQERMRTVRAAKEAATVAWMAAGCLVWDVPVVVDWTIRRGRAMDDDGAIGSLKTLRDGLFVGRITPDDSPRWVVTGTVTQETGRRWRGREEVEARVRRREG